jgi:hypothetical protein
VAFLRYQILLLVWVFYLPFFEVFVSVLKCSGGKHYIDTHLDCFAGIHIFYVIISMLFLALLFAVGLIIAALYNETQPVQEDCLSRQESSFEVALIVYRSIIVTFSIFCDSEACSWILITVYLVSSLMLCFQYYKQIPFYNQFVSVFAGSLIYLYLWIALNALLMKLVRVDGHIIVIFAGIPLIAYLVHNLRENRIDQLIKLNIDKLQIDIDALIQINCMSDFTNGVDKDP